MRYEIADQIADAVKNRDTWHTRQKTWYTMRHNGIRRTSPPHKGAADLHFPLIDSHIERLKPFYYQQLYGKEQFASFVSLKTQPADVTGGVAAWFDYRLKNKTNFEKKVLVAIDAMCMSGRSVMKVFWDFNTKQLCCAAVPPYYFIVPSYVNELADDAEWCVHVMELSVAQYKRNPHFKQDKEFIERIKGRNVGDFGVAGTNPMYQEVKKREGITVASTDDCIIIWEIYRKQDDGIYFDTYNPMNMEESDKIRETEKLPYDYPDFPFISFRSEIKDEGWYSPRGVPEIIASFEDSLCRQWNFKHDWMDYFNKPLFKQKGGSVGNTTNIKFLPGQVLPQGVEPVESKAPPLSFDQEMQTTRALAEYRMNVPDLGASTHLQGRATARGDVTATQVNAIVGQSGLTDDMRSRVFRLDLAEFFKMAWSLYKQFDKESLTYVLYDEVGQLTPEAFQGEYEISPNGTAESWNKPAMLQKAIARKQLFGQSPFWDQAELEKSIMELDDPRMIRRAFRDPKDELKEQGEAQAQEIAVMLLGFPAVVKLADDDKAHFQTIQEFVDRQVHTMEGKITPEVAQLLIMHCAQHDQQLQQKRDPALGELRAHLQPVMLYLQAKASLVGAAQGMPNNIVPLGGAGSNAGSDASFPAQAGPPGGDNKQDPIGDATKVMNALATLKKANVPITDQEVNAALAAAGLPPLEQGQPLPEPVEHLPSQGMQ